MLVAARLASSYAAAATYEFFISNVEKQDAIIRRIELIGEAANQVSAATRDLLPQIDWRRIIGMRHILIHHYRDVDLGFVWSVVINDLPHLIRELERYLDR